MEYKNRIADQLLRDKLEAMGAVLIEGPKACGKTTTAEQQAKSIIYMDDPTKQQQYKQMAQTNISFLLEGETPRLIDEWQEVPQFWDAIRFEVDHRGEDGQFMLTGSAVPAEAKDIHHTGTGRYGWLTMRPMSLFETVSPPRRSRAPNRQICSRDPHPASSRAPNRQICSRGPRLRSLSPSMSRYYLPTSSS